MSSSRPCSCLAYSESTLAGDRLESEVTSLLWMSNYLETFAMCLTRILVDCVQFMIIIIGSGGELQRYVKRVRVEMAPPQVSNASHLMLLPGRVTCVYTESGGKALDDRL